MKYEVLKDFTDDDFKVPNADGEKSPLTLTAGEIFTPATIHYPQAKIDRAVSGGILRPGAPEFVAEYLNEPVAPEAPEE